MKLYNSAVEWDTWGQVVEAAEAYEKYNYKFGICDADLLSLFAA